MTSLKTPVPVPAPITRWQDITNVHYINLERRKDRFEWMQRQLALVGMDQTAKRFNAIPMKNGAVGCTMSHLALLEQAVKDGASHILILEDDIQFNDADAFIQHFNQFLAEYAKTATEPWDVILISGNNFPPCVSVNPNGIQIWNCNTTTGYLVNGHYLFTLAQNVREGLLLLLRNGMDKTKYAIDIHWKILQQRDHWFLIMPLTITQRADYSDIEERHVDYSHFMLTADKTAIMEEIKRQREMAALSAHIANQHGTASATLPPLANNTKSNATTKPNRKK